MVIGDSFFMSNRSNFYQISHLAIGFIFDPTGQLKSFAKSFKLLNGPSTRNSFGGCSSVLIWFTRYSVVETVHIIWADAIQNMCCWLYLRPGKTPSGPLRFAHRLYALYASFAPPVSAIFSSIKIRALKPKLWTTMKLEHDEAYLLYWFHSNWDSFLNLCSCHIVQWCIWPFSKNVLL